MVHWSLLIVTFVLGFGTCYLILYQLAKLAARVEGAIERATKYIMPF